MRYGPRAKGGVSMRWIARRGYDNRPTAKRCQPELLLLSEILHTFADPKGLKNRTIKFNSFGTNQDVRDERPIVVYDVTALVNADLVVRLLGQHDVVDKILNAVEQRAALHGRESGDCLQVYHLIHQVNEFLFGIIFRKLSREV